MSVTDRYSWGLREIMAELGVSQNQLSHASRVRPATLRAFVNGDVQRINLEQLTDLLDALNRLAAAQSFRKRYNVEDLLYYNREE
ncbi:helix-turn-helix transcriptional regulator [Alkalihalobacillus sp. LMS6]|jgi:DNA-binding Xre family transcriptional regulator|uniref:helix-turn-helix domain-containing protein n=1 Tax=Alkalihalobacillus sp. LMS6 TaxID=2924034 RepID=UPI0020D05EC5|nr:helix-turn-helix transcriptional regulator [Alkalihalobacillus sp. LMS6]UTR05213.1 helix-turn-helix transcriptional regulator [Alkalihalobacillus sp. LMS6]